MLAARLLLAATLYAFLGWAFWLIWQELRQQAQQLTSPNLPALNLLRAGDARESALRFSRAEVIIGRERGCDCCLDDKTISARHARLAYHHGQWWVEDLGSKNGTFLNLERVSLPVVLAAGDELRCGQVLWQVTMEGSEDNPADEKNPGVGEKSDL